MTDDAEDDPVAAGRVGEAGHGSSAASDFPETSFNDIGGAHLAPVRLGNGEKAEQFLPVALQAGHGAGTQRSPFLRPGTVDTQSGAAPSRRQRFRPRDGSIVFLGLLPRPLRNSLNRAARLFRSSPGR